MDGVIEVTVDEDAQFPDYVRPGPNIPFLVGVFFLSGGVLITLAAIVYYMLR